MAQYMVCDKAGETLKQNRFSDATLEFIAESDPQVLDESL